MKKERISLTPYLILLYQSFKMSISSCSSNPRPSFDTDECKLIFTSLNKTWKKADKQKPISQFKVIFQGQNSAKSFKI